MKIKQQQKLVQFIIHKKMQSKTTTGNKRWL